MLTSWRYEFSEAIEASWAMVQIMAGMAGHDRQVAASSVTVSHGRLYVGARQVVSTPEVLQNMALQGSPYWSVWRLSWARFLPALQDSPAALPPAFQQLNDLVKRARLWVGGRRVIEIRGGSWQRALSL